LEWIVPKLQFCILALCVLVAVWVPSTNCAAAELRLATWNIETLTTGKQVFPDQPLRTPEDMVELEKFARTVTAAVIALQEISSPAAAATLFPLSDWTICISGQFFEAYQEFGNSATAVCFSDEAVPDTPGPELFAKQFVGFAIRKSNNFKITISDLPELGVMHRDPKDDVERPLRWGLVLRLQTEDTTIELLNVHLKSGCLRSNPYAGKKADPKYEDCKTFGEQVPHLKRYVLETQKPFVLVGDFNRHLDPSDHLFLRLTGKSNKKKRSDDIELHELTSLNAAPCLLWKSPKRVDHFIGSAGVSGTDLQIYVPQQTQEVDAKARRRRFGDHCPISTNVKF
jgi:endonuclease/exonuclease/phosphatase family metal-dependent hydrolase